jgi:hypothetical protein
MATRKRKAATAGGESGAADELQAGELDELDEIELDEPHELLGAPGVYCDGERWLAATVVAVTQNRDDVPAALVVEVLDTRAGHPSATHAGALLLERGGKVRAGVFRPR